MRSKIRNCCGMHIIEMLAGLFVLIPVVLYGADYAVALMGQSINTTTCREAARAAANGPPSVFTKDPKNTPEARATRSISLSPAAHSAIKVKKTVKYEEVIEPPVPSPPFGGPVRGHVTIKTRTTVFPPFDLPFVPQKVVLYDQKTFPFTWTMPSTFNTTGGPGGTGTGGPNPGPVYDPSSTNSVGNLKQEISDSEY